MTSNEYYYTQQINSLVGERQRYINLRDKISGSLIPALQTPYNDLQSAKSAIKISYEVENNGVGEKDVDKIIEKLNANISKLSGSVIPEINSKISSINGSIDYFDYLLRLEREKGE